nr:immunoglobulin heavy chain junction region [Macaca mulatta]
CAISFSTWTSFDYW